MAYIHVNKRSNLSETEFRQRMKSIEHLKHASADINDWRFTVQSAPEWAPRSCDHVFEGKCRKTGITNAFLVDLVDADADGSFEPRHKEIIEHFAQSLLYLKHMQAEYRRRVALKRRGLVLPDAGVDFGSLARYALQRGDHPQ